MTTLQDFSNDLAATVKAVQPAVVRVEGRKRMPASGVVWSADGIVVTANHVVRADQGVRVGLADGRTVEATVVGRDRATDIAVLQVNGSDLTTLDRVNENESAVGSLVLALARPGSGIQATVGILSAAGSAWHTRAGGQIERYLQTDVLMYPGFSGGPLLDAGGRLLGMNSSALVQGISVALPAVTLERVVSALQKDGRVGRAYLGVSTQRVRLPEDVAAALEQRGGLLIVSVESDSPAATAGLTLGDTIVGLGSLNVRTHEDLLAALMASSLEEKTPLKIVRAGEIQSLNVQLTSRA